MSDYMEGLLAIPAAALVVVLAIVAWNTASSLVDRYAPLHWSLQGPHGKRVARPPRDIFRTVNAGRRRVASFRRLIAVGPWTVYVARYRPGVVDEADPLP